MSWTRILSTAAWLLLLAAIPRADAQRPLGDFLTEKDLRDSIQRWRGVQETYYRTLFEKQFSIVVGDETSAFVVNEYLKRRLAPVFSESIPVSRVVIKRDLWAVMTASLMQGIFGRYKTFSDFVLSQVNDRISIEVKNIQAAIQAQNCNVIPCPPDKCEPDCSPKAFNRFR